MGQIKELLKNLSPRQRIYIAAAAVLVVAALVAFTRWKHERDFRPLYTALSAEDAGAVVQKLKESGVEYRLTDNGSTVQAPAERLSELRLQMASAGLPKTGRAGFELFDKTNFGATDFAEHINYRRALEGELERSIMGLSEIETARVHLTFPKESVFVEARQPAKASVMLKIRTGAKISPANVTAVCHLISSAVEGLAPEAVSVLDMNGNLLNRPRREDPDGNQPSEAALEYKRQIEKDLLTKINSTLEPVVGPERFRAGVSVECDFSNGEQTDESFDPSRSVMTSSQKTEDVSGGALASGVPGTASSLPRPTSRPGAAGIGTTRRTESVAYQSSRTVRRMRLPQGGLKRISASVLVDQNLRWEGVGPKAKRILEPPSPEKMKAIRDLVAAAIGFDTARGDQLILETLPFEATLAIEPPPAPPAPLAPPAPFSVKLPDWLERMPGQKKMIVMGAAAGVVVLLAAAGAFFFLRRRKQKQVAIAAALAAAKAPAGALAPGESPADAAKRELEAKLANRQSEQARLDAEALSSLQLPAVTSKRSEVLSKHIGESVGKDPVAAAQILRTWLNEGKQA
ncbi:MAG TPA: flagellar basal-body MS-ring/collar protein FliF [Bryobacteraceae bacterium]|nr:flagellar basal-body MS-ring/collar protein FliF [Bryobacteraceae bacterium]